MILARKIAYTDGTLTVEKGLLSGNDGKRRHAKAYDTPSNHARPITRWTADKSSFHGKILWKMWLN